MWLELLLNLIDGKGNMSTSQSACMFPLSNDTAALFILKTTYCGMLLTEFAKYLVKTNTFIHGIYQHHL